LKQKQNPIATPRAKWQIGASSMSKIVLDIETKNTFADVGGKENLKNLDVSVTCVYSYDTDSYVCFNEHEMEGLTETLKKARLIIGFSINRFDIPVLEKYMPFNLTAIPRLDLLEEIEYATGSRISLDLLAKHNLGTQKTYHGLEAVRLYREGNMKELIEYCTKDVEITKNLYDLVRRQRYLLIPDRFTGELKKVKLELQEELLPTGLF